MRFLYLIEEHDGVGLAAYCLCQLTTLVIAYIARRCTDQSADGMLLLIFRHIDTGHHRLVVEEVFGKCLGKLRLTDTRSTEEDK